MGQPQLDQLLEVSTQFVASAVEPDRWESALGEFSRLFDGAFATFEVIDKSTGRLVDYFGKSNVEITKEYLDHFMPRNPRLHFGMQPTAGKILHDNQFISDREMDRHEFYQVFLRPFDLRYFLCVNAYQTDSHVCAFTVQRNGNKGPVSTDDLAMLHSLRPALSRSAEIHVTHGRRLARQAGLEAALHCMTDGVILIDSGGSVVDMNDAATEITRREDGISIFRGQVVLSQAHANSKLRKLLGDLIRAGVAADVPASMAVQRRSQLPPYHLRAHWLGREARTWTGRPVIALFAHDPCHKAAMDAGLLGEAFGLSPAEANLAIAIEAGVTVEAYARTGGVSVATIRTQLQKAMQKLGVQRQLDLARSISAFRGDLR